MKVLTTSGDTVFTFVEWSSIFETGPLGYGNAGIIIPDSHFRSRMAMLGTGMLWSTTVNFLAYSRNVGVISWI